MCRAYVLRFSCAHGVLMGFEPCRLAPCPIIKTSGERLPQQPYRCYNCQHRKESKTSRAITPRSKTSCAPQSAIFDSEGMDDAAVKASFRRAQSFPVAKSSVYHTLPNVAKQPKGCIQLSIAGKSSSPAKRFKFECQNASHPLSPHYYGLPQHLPHQDHSCPPCQLQEMRIKGEEEAVQQAISQYPKLTVEMLVRNGTIKEFQQKPSWERYLDEIITDEREMWHHVTRKWTQDLKRCRVLVAEEDGLGLFA